jgi:hypothetical protein
MRLANPSSRVVSETKVCFVSILVVGAALAACGPGGQYSRSTGRATVTFDAAIASGTGGNLATGGRTGERAPGTGGTDPADWPSTGGNDGAIAGNGAGATVGADAGSSIDGDGSLSATGGMSPGTGGAAPARPGTGGSALAVLSIDFVGGRASTGVAGAVLIAAPVMASTEVAGLRAAAHWNSAMGATGSLQTLALADGTATGASVSWNSPGTTTSAGVWRLGYGDAAGDVRMMAGYLDPAWFVAPVRPVNLVTVSGLPSAITARPYDVYVYTLGDPGSGETRSYQYGIGDATLTVTQIGPTPTNPPTPYPYVLASNGGMGNCVVFRSISGASFTLTALPLAATFNRFRAPVNGLQIVAATLP